METTVRVHHRMVKGAAAAIALLSAFPGTARAQDSVGPASGTRVLHKEIVVRAPIEDVWRAWTTNEGISFVSGDSNIELRVGGPYELFLDLPPDERGVRGAQGSRVLAFLEPEMLAFAWRFPRVVPTLRAEGATTQVVVLLDDLGNGRVHIDLTAQGWQNGEDWDAGYRYFDHAWQYVLETLKSSLETEAPTAAAARREERDVSYVLRSFYRTAQANVLGAARMVPESEYEFRPTEEVRSVGELLGHIADALFSFCAAGLEQPNPTGAVPGPGSDYVPIEARGLSKAETEAVLGDAFEFCDPLFRDVRDPWLADPIQGPMAGLPLAYSLVIVINHTTHHYGNLVTYVRLLGHTPPSSGGA